MDRIVSKPAFYVTARKPRDLMRLPSNTIDALLTFLPGRRRVARFGAWRRRIQPSNPPRSYEMENDRG